MVEVYNEKHFLQSLAWASFWQSLGKEVIVVENKGWSYLAILNNGRGYSELYIPYGPWATDQDNLMKALKSVVDLALSRQVSYMRIEPSPNLLTTELMEHIASDLGISIIKSPRQIQPNYTRVISLDEEKEKIILAMNASTRNLHNNFYKKDLKIIESGDYKDITYIVDMLRGTKTKGVIFHSLGYMSKQAEVLIKHKSAKIFLIKDAKGQVLSGAFVYTSSNVWYFAHASSNAIGKSMHLNQPLVSSIILKAKDAGAKYFDLYGVADPDNPNDKLYYISKFKQQFGGSVEHISTTYDIILNKKKYKIYKLMLVLSVIKKKILLILMSIKNKF